MDVQELVVQAWESQAAAERYERARPPYALGAIRFVVETLGLGPSSRLLDLAAGTGKLTRLFHGLVGEIVAVEPLESMRRVLAQSVADVQILEGRGEDIPLPDGSVDAAVAGQAWHWFDSARALAEVTRVTRASAGLALFWNEYDEQSELIRNLARLRESYAGDAPSHTTDDWRGAFVDSSWGPLRMRSFSHVVHGRREMLVERVFSSSVISVLPQAEKDRIRAQILELLDSHPTTAGTDEIEIPYQTEVFWTEKR
jgi:SAM-dependent methyltransferase